jgi:acetyltransferase-like isoleucine patch superfamily enzyme
MLAAGSVVGPNTTIGRFCIVNTCTSIDHDNVLEDGVNLSPGVHFAGTVTCRQDAFVGVGATAIPGVIIGTRAVVGAGATVTTDVPDDTTVVGTPARPIKRATI